MKTYLVELIETWRYQMAVDAESETEAKRIATDRWNGSPDPVTGNERTCPIAVTHDGELDDDCNIVVMGEIKEHCRDTGYYDDILHVGNDGLDIG